MFVEEHATQYNPETDSYDISPFSEPIETTKATAIYNMHVYWSKKPHDAVCKYISHYTELGDLVLDPFCGSGGTALAALIEGRKAIAIDRSPAATFITKNYCTPVNPDVLRLALQQLKQKIEQEINWLYETACDRCGGRAITGYTVYSEVFQCPRCLNKVPLFDCIEVQTETKQGKHPKIPVCPHCHPKHREAINTELENRFGSIPVLVTYQCLSGCKPRRGKRLYNDQDKRKREFFEQYDLSKLREIEGKPIPHWYPPHKMMNVTDDSQPWGDKWRAGTSNFRTVAELFTKRNLWALAAIRAGIIAVADDLVKDALLFGLTGIALNSSKMYKERDNGRGISSGTYYMPPISREMVVTNGFYYKVEQQLIPAFRELQSYGSLIFSRVFNIWQRFEITQFLKADGPSALCLFGPVDPSVCCGVTVRLYEGSENQRVIGQCLELV